MIKQSLKLIWRRKGSNGLLVLEFFLTFLVLYVTGAMLFNGIHRYLQPDGFDIDNVVSISAYQSQYASGSDEGGDMLPRFRNTLRDIPTVQDVGLIVYELYRRRLVGDRLTIHGTPITVSSTALSDNCEDILSIDLIEGRWFSAEDDAGQYEPVIINAMFRDEAFDGENPVGVIIGDVWQIVGVVSDLRIFGKLDEPQPLLIERTTFNSAGSSSVLLARLSIRPDGEMIATILAALQAVAPDWSFVVTPAEELRAARITEEATPYVVAGMTALLLMCMVVMGLFGVLWQNITRRTREIGLRRAKGANIGDIHTQIIGEMLLVTTIGILPGILIVVQLIAIDVMGSIPMSVHMIALVCASVFLYLIVPACSLYPGHMATRISPAQALHYE